MKLIVDDIPDAGLSVSANSDTDGWLCQIFETAMGNKIQTGDSLQLTLTVTAIGTQVECVGGYYYTIHPTCDRCGVTFSLDEQIPLHFHYISDGDTDMGRQDSTVEVNANEDEDFSIYQGRAIDLDPMLYEQLSLAQPVVYLCKEDCRGLCSRCGANLNDSPCRCPPQKAPHPFEALKGIKIPSRKP